MTRDQQSGAISRLLCTVSGHNWSMEPPWTGKEIRWNPHCERCGYEPEEIAITGKSERDHRV